MGEILHLNGERVRLRTCNHVFSERLAVISLDLPLYFQTPVIT